MKKTWIALVLLVVVLFAAILIRLPSFGSTPESEIEEIVSLQTTAERIPLVQKLLERVGPVETQELLHNSGLPATGETHLLVHTIGEFIYEKYGRAGLSLCKDYFLSACYHAFIIQELSRNGQEGLVQTLELCAQKGEDVRIQCSHAIGHGFLAFLDYDLLSALASCDFLGASSQNLVLFNCHDGVFMENIYGVHGGRASPKRWINTNDPYYPCNDSRIKAQYLGACWSNQATVMYQLYRGDLKKVAQGCDTVGNQTYKQYCYHNFARQIHPLTEGNPETAVSLCELATGDVWQQFCVKAISAAAYSLGDTIMSQALCRSLPVQDQPGCATMRGGGPQ